MQCFLRFIFLWLVLSTRVEAQQGESDEAELTQIYWDVLTSYNAFPPLDSASVWLNGTIEPIQVFIGAVIVSIDVISPATSEFTVSARKLLYWNREACNQTLAHRYACDNPVGTLHFLAPRRSNANPNTNYELHQEEVHVAEFAALGLPELTPSLDIVEDQVTFKQQFDMATYPYEYHNLEISYRSKYSSNVVNLTMLPINAGSINPSVPAGWTLQDVNCVVSVGQEGSAISQVSQGEIFFPTITCTLQVLRWNTGWWMTSFLLFVGLNFMSFIGGLGLTSHLVAEAKDDKDKARGGLFDGMRMNGVFSLGLLLTYVFQVEISPYGQSLEYWPSMAASTMIYVVGLFGILISSLCSLSMGLLAKKYLVVHGYAGGIRQCYNLKDVPIEGEDPEEDFPLRDMKREYAHASKKHANGNGVFTNAKKVLTMGKKKAGSGVGQPTHQPNPTAKEMENSGDEEAQTPAKEMENSVDEEAEAHPVDPPFVEHAIPSAEEKDSERTPAARGQRTKMYNVLSVQEARRVNQFVWVDFITRTIIMVVIAMAGAGIMVWAKIRFETAVSR